MFKIYNYGDCIINGEYYIHSSFRNIKNYFSENNIMLSISDSTDLSSPNTVIIDHFYFEPKKVQFNNNSISFDDINISLFEANKTDSSFFFKRIEKVEIEKKIKNISEILLPFSENYLFLKIIYDINHLSNSAIENGIYNSFKNGIGFLKKNDLFQGLKFIKGIGNGLTPSGDDFIAGIVIATFVLEKYLNKSLSEIRNSIFEFMKDSNIYSINFLRYLVNGNFNNYFKIFLEAFYSSDIKELENSVYKLQKVGASSGIDVLAGFIFTLKYLFYDN